MNAKYLLTILLVVSLNTSNSQTNEFDKYLMVTATKLTIREEPNINSRNLGLVEKNKLVRIIDRRSEDRYLAKVDNILDSWAKIEYDGIVGYMFGGYLGNEVLIPNDNWQGEYLLLSEGDLVCGVFSDKLKWYGIYSKNDGEYVKRVKVKLEYIEKSEMGEHLKVSTNLKEKSIILIGTNRHVRIGKVGIPIGNYKEFLLRNNIRLPLPTFENKCLVKNNFTLNVFYSGTKGWPCNDTKYIIRLDFMSQDNSIRYNTKIEGVPNEYDKCEPPFLNWFGDINDDQIPDFIFENRSTSSITYKLYLSSKKDDFFVIEKVWPYSPGINAP